MPTVLIVDDEPAVLNVLGTVFNARGYTTVLAPNGDVALQSFDSVDAALIDINMPGMNGFAVCEAIRTSPAHADVPVWMMSGAVTESAVRQARAVGARTLLHKPFKLLDLIAEISAVVAAKGAVCTN